MCSTRPLLPFGPDGVGVGRHCMGPDSCKLKQVKALDKSKGFAL